MKLNEAEMRMAYQIESTDPNAVLNEIYMTWRLSRNQASSNTFLGGYDLWNFSTAQLTFCRPL